jgi:nucleotide-binding universal stress UspA family protein
MGTFDELVVAVGAPGGNAGLIAYAARLAALGRARTVRFVHVADPVTDATALRAQMYAELGSAFATTPAEVDCDVLHGPLSDRLLAFATEFQADLVLVGSQRRTLGARLAMVAACSVAVLPDERPSPLTHVLVAFDFSPAATETLSWATRLVAADPTIRCTALHVMTHESTELFAGHESEEAQAAEMARIIATANVHGVAIASRLARPVRGADIGTSHPFSLPAAIQGSDVAHTILSEAAACGADCVVLSTRGRSRSASILLGSVAEKVVERAEVPVLIGKHGPRNLGLVEILLGRASSASTVKTS